ncbi:hypothetical protein AAG906_026310 [Vitis piasezkii]
MEKLLEAQIHEETKLWSLIVLCLSRSKYARKEQWREESSEENRGQQLQFSFALLEHFTKSIFYILYTISKLRNQESNASNHDVFPEDERLNFWFLGYALTLNIPCSSSLCHFTIYIGFTD